MAESTITDGRHTYRLQTIGRVFGWFFLATFLTSIPAYFIGYARILEDPGLITGAGADPGAGVATAATLEVFLIVFNVATAVVAYPILKRESEIGALGYVAARLVEGIFIAIGIVGALAFLLMRLEVTAPDAALGEAFVAIYYRAFLLGPGFMAGLANGVILGYLMYRTGLVPRGMAVLGLIGGPLVMVTGIAVMFDAIERGGAVQVIATLPEAIWELSLSIYCIVKGFEAFSRPRHGARDDPARVRQCVTARNLGSPSGVLVPSPAHGATRHPYTRPVRTFPVTARALIALSLVVAALATMARASAAPVVRTPADPRSLVELRSDATGRVWRGTMSIAFTNAGAGPLDEIYLRLWSNGVQGCDPVAIVVRDLTGGTPSPLAQRCTTLGVDLDDPLAPGARGSVAFTLTIRVPARNDRFGHVRGLSMLGSALPALAIQDDAGWNLPPFVDLGESFYSVAGTYRVTLDTPEDLVTPTTGVRVARRISNGRSIATFTARDVRDFEWAAGELRRLVSRAGATRVALSYLPDAVSRSTAKRMIGHAQRSMRMFIRSFGPYPYPEVDVVLTGFASFGGMEYPTFVLSNANKLTIAHELAHQWWFGTVGNDQFSEPWLDEGFATWSQQLPWDAWRRCTGINWPSPGARMTNDMAYWRDHANEYGTVVYHGGGCLLAQLADGFGLDRFLRILERYAGRFRHDIARTEDFQAAIDRAADRHWPGFPADFWSDWRVEP